MVSTIAAACERLNLQMAGLRVAVQGFGNVGSVAAQAIAERGASVVAVSDVNGATYCKDGLDVRAVGRACAGYQRREGVCGRRG